jgi:hypothetical protein
MAAVWTDEELRQLGDMAARGTAIERMARSLRRSQQAVKQQLRRRGLLA